jgi:hypothetical protein
MGRSRTGLQTQFQGPVYVPPIVGDARRTPDIFRLVGSDNSPVSESKGNQLNADVDTVAIVTPLFTLS